MICEILTFICTEMRLAAGLCPDPLGSLQRSPDPWLDFRVMSRERRRRERRRGNGRGEKEGENKKLVTGLKSILCDA